MLPRSVVLFALFVGVFSLPSRDEVLTGDDLVNFLNSKQSLFKAKKWERVNREKLIMKKDSVRRVMDKPAPEIEWIKDDEIPNSYDPRLLFPNCSSLFQIRDQGDCGSCWAVSSAEVMSDRTCIASGGVTQFTAAADDILSCCPTCGGCDGGIPAFAFKHWNTHGIVTGGEYNSHIGCRPYPYTPIDKIECKTTCEPGYPLTYAQDKHFGDEYYELLPGAKGMQKEILAHGPIVACFQFYTDFYDYKSGIYTQTSGKHDGMHCVKILGWGSENGTPYWLAANSWGADWGENGYFRFIRGIDDCGFENYAAAGTPK